MDARVKPGHDAEYVAGLVIFPHHSFSSFAALL